MLVLNEDRMGASLWVLISREVGMLLRLGRKNEWRFEGDTGNIWSSVHHPLLLKGRVSVWQSGQ